MNSFSLTCRSCKGTSSDDRSGCGRVGHRTVDHLNVVLVAVGDVLRKGAVEENIHTQNCSHEKGKKR